MDRDALARRLEASAYVAREAGMEIDEILAIVRAGVTAADAAKPKAPALLEEYRRTRLAS